MFKFLFFIFFLFILLLMLMGFSVLRMFKRAFFGNGNATRREAPSYRTNPQGNRAQTASTRRDETQEAEEVSYNERRKHTPHRKIFSKDDGEYVDFEEVKS